MGREPAPELRVPGLYPPPGYKGCLAARLTPERRAREPGRAQDFFSGLTACDGWKCLPLSVERLACACASRREVREVTASAGETVHHFFLSQEVRSQPLRSGSGAVTLTAQPSSPPSPLPHAPKDSADLMHSAHRAWENVGGDDFFFFFGHSFLHFQSTASLVGSYLSKKTFSLAGSSPETVIVTSAFSAGDVSRVAVPDVGTHRPT